MYRALYVTGAYNDEDKKGHVYPGLYAFVGFVVWEHTRKPKKP